MKFADESLASGLNGASGVNWRVIDGYGAVIAAHGDCLIGVKNCTLILVTDFFNSIDPFETCAVQGFAAQN
jgi:hypothetical protein